MVHPSRIGCSSRLAQIWSHSPGEGHFSQSLVLSEWAVQMRLIPGKSPAGSFPRSSTRFCQFLSHGPPGPEREGCPCPAGGLEGGATPAATGSPPGWGFLPNREGRPSRVSADQGQARAAARQHLCLGFPPPCPRQGRECGFPSTFRYCRTSISSMKLQSPSMVMAVTWMYRACTSSRLSLKTLCQTEAPRTPGVTVPRGWKVTPSWEMA